MTTADFPDCGLVFWQVGTGDSTTVVIDDTHVLQIDLHDMAMADEDDAVVVPVVDRIVEALPERDGMPYLAAFVLTHADKDHCLGFADLLERVMIGEIWATPRLWREYTDHDVELCEDAKAFHEEVLQRVDETLEAVERGEEPASGDRVRVVAKKRGCLENLIGASKVADLLAELRELGPLGTRHPRADTDIDLGPLHPRAKRLVANAELASHPPDHAVITGVLAPKLEDHAHGTLPQLIWIPLVGSVSSGHAPSSLPR